MKKIYLLISAYSILFSHFACAQNVGIGITSPTEKLQVDSGSIKIGRNPWTQGNDNILKFGDGSFVTIGEAGEDDQMQLNAKQFIFTTSNGTGNVGVGVADPAEKLVVAGGVQLQFSGNNNAGTLRYNTTPTYNGIDYNTGFGWRSLVNNYKDSSLSSLSPFNSTTRNAFVTIPGVSMTVSDAGTYLVIFKISGINNNVYSPSGGNYDQDCIAYFLLNHGTIGNSRRFLLKDVSGSGTSSQISFSPNPTEYSTVLNLNQGDVLTMEAEIISVGTVSGTWTINEAEITTVRLY